MDLNSRIEFERILALGPDSISESEIAFLRARRSYLTEEQKAVFAAVLDAEESGEAEKPLAEMNRRELAKIAKGLGVDQKQFPEDADLIAAIEEARAAASQ
jgi:hypothetical protein